MSNPIPRQEYIRSGTVESLNVTGELKYQGVPVAPGGGTDEKAKVSSNDTTPGYLDGKLVAGSGITLTQNNDGGDETLTITSADTNDAVKVSSNDTTPGDLEAKLVAGTNITLTTNNDGSNETLTIAAAGGVTGFTGSQNTASPNNTVNASQLLVDATSTNADAVLQPKGTGALLAQLPDGAVSGGNKRGNNAVDLQSSRSSSAAVASGSYACIIGGANNKCAGAYSVAGGQGSTAPGWWAVSIGYICEANNTGSVAFGYVAKATTSYCTAIGREVTASADYAIALGRESVSNRIGMYSHAVGRFANAGDCQYERYIIRRATTDATPTILSCDGGAPASSTRIGIASDATYTFRAMVTARRTDADNESAGWEVKGVIDNNAGTTALVGSVTVTAIGDDSAGTWTVAVTADNTNDALQFEVTGEAGKTIRWGATVTLMKVAG